ncbi:MULTISPECIES: hypothetical protein [Fictibacillus]|uniref:Uncharacterized protein n=1 Tax=Fictibacillus terranigra TaxID=3058424 RepID=A0ABT8E2I2_9BACL|nr:hypothetical protein [Fictibacillus sp. CENA-BCM004]MDN4072106.1 hypothetical protein [Fictibacillus sp. CENA-BCM004]
MNEPDQMKALNQLLEIIHYKGNKRKLPFLALPYKKRKQQVKTLRP